MNFSLNTEKNYISLVLLHILLATGVFLFKPLGKILFVVVLIYFLMRIILASNSNKGVEVLYACSYFVGIEVLFRMTKSNLAYESSKYLVILFMLMGMFFKGISGKGYPYFIYMILLLPAVLIASITLRYNVNFRTNIAFVLSGPVCLGIASLFCYNLKIRFKELMSVLLFMTYPLIATTTYLFLYNPSIKDTLSGTASNLASSGGFGPNQVATVLGLGMFCIVVRFFLRSPNIFLKIFNVTILGLITYRAIVTFSRGGVIVAVIVITVFLGSLFLKSSYKQKNQILASFFLLIVTISVTWIISSNNTFGLIDKRYANKDAQGREKTDITTGRVELFNEEVEGFLESPFLGIGASRTKDKRVEEYNRNLPSHNEIGRLLAEHGLLGIVCILILIFTPLSFRSENKKNLLFYAFLCFWFATINHSGLRIAAPSFIYALSLLNISYEKNPLYRKQIKQ